MLQEMMREAVRELVLDNNDDTQWGMAVEAMSVIACEVDGTAATHLCVANALESLVQVATDLRAPSAEVKKCIIEHARELIAELRAVQA